METIKPEHKKDLHDRVKERCAELSASLADLQTQNAKSERARAVEEALAALQTHLTGNWETIDDSESAALTRWLESSRFLFDGHIAATATEPYWVRVDARVELISIVFHLAGASEFARSFDSPYRRAVDAHFAPFAEHPVIAATRELRSQFGVAHNAPMALAVHLDPQTLELVESPDAHWHNVPITDFLTKLRDFAVVSGFSAFFTAQKPYITAVEERLSNAFTPQRVGEWFKATLVAPQVSFMIVPGLLTGPWSYDAFTHDATGPRSYEIVELENADKDGLPVPTSLTMDIIVHEMAHAHVNPLVERNLGRLAVAAPIFDKLRMAMEMQAYRSWPVMVEESLVRALTTLFILDGQGRAAATTEVVQEQQRGFVWMPQLVERLAQLRATAGGKLDLEARLDELVAFFAAIADELAPIAQA
jgi:hypothetical protein